MRRHRILALPLVVAGLVATAALAGAPSATAAPPIERTDDATARQAAEHQRIIDFWTVERVRRAVPRDFVLTPKGFRPAAKPGGGAGTTTGSSWTGGGAVLKTTGKVLFAMGGSYYVCSGDVIQDGTSGRSVVLTAGHCVYDETNHAFATNWTFVPEYDSAPASLTTSLSFCAQTTLGCWTASALVVHSGFTTAGSFNTQATLHDWGFAVLGPGGKDSNTLVDDVTAAQDVTFTGTQTVGTTVSAFGYPAAGRFKGTDLVYCRGPLTTDPNNGDRTWGVRCTMTGGSSGGPWFGTFNDNSGVGTQMSVNSYGYSGVSYMFGPKFDSKTQATFQVALTEWTNTVVP
jgi:V8-like Glu-specific endopeptidase